MATATHLRRYYILADRKFGFLVDKFRQDVPRSLAIAHIAIVNPYNLNAPVIKDYRRGCMRVSISACRRANTNWDKLTDPMVCTYAWFTDTNRVSYLLNSANPTLFPTPDEDFWKCAYMKVMLQDPAFDALWDIASPVAGKTGGVYGQLSAKVGTLRGALPGWTVPKLRKQVLLDLETTFALAKLYGPLTSTGPGRPPYLSGDDTNRIFVE